MPVAVVAEPERDAGLLDGVDGLASLGPDSANGFSQNTCLPAFAAAIVCGTCSECGVASTTASKPGCFSMSSKLL